MDFSKIPFTLYDFFGYLASGFLLILGCPFVPCSIRVKMNSMPLASWVLFTIVIYILGHVLSSLSKWLYELFIVDVCLKRPYINLLSEKDSRVLKVAFPEYFIPLSEEIRQKIVGKKCIARDKADPEKLRGLYERAYAHVKDNKDASARLDTFLSL